MEKRIMTILYGMENIGFRNMMKRNINPLNMEMAVSLTNFLVSSGHICFS